MLRVALVDDEPSALKNMEHIMSGLPGVLIAGTYTDSGKALAAMEKDRPDAVFVDIEMPGKSGLELAEELADKYPDIRVVFVTAYNQYAVAAFEEGAADYLLKPVRRERLEKTLARLEKAEKRDDKPGAPGGGNGSRIQKPGKPGIQCFRKFTVYTASGVPLGFRTRKTEELLALFVHFRQNALSREKIIDFLWPESGAEKAGVLLHTTLYNLKKALGELQGGMELIKAGGGYMLRLNDMDCDAEELEKRLPGLKKAGGGNAAEFEDAIRLYTGAYFEEDGYRWAEDKRFAFNERMTEICMELGLHYQCAALWEKAADMMESLLRIDAMNEEAYDILIRCCRGLENAGRMRQAYDRYRAMMKELGLPPEPLEELGRD